MKAFITFLVVFGSLTANAAKFKCYGSKYPSGMEHFFGEGYTILDVSKKMVNLKYYYINTVAGETTLEIDANYNVGGIQGGNGALKGMTIGSLVDFRSYPGDSIDTIHFSTGLFENTPASGIVGKFVFPGQGYSYDWNICYNTK